MSVQKIIIVTPSYSEKVGGAVVLHKLCSVLRQQGHEAYLYPFVTSFYLSRFNWINSIFLAFRQFVRVFLALNFGKFDRYEEFNTPLYDGNIDSIANDGTIVVYPETVQGNPLNAKNVVRWLLHQPGFHTGDMSFSRGDVLVKFNSAIRDIRLDGVNLINSELKVIHYPLEHYYLPNQGTVRSGTAVCIRKGAGKPFVHDDAAIVIDDLSHAEVGEILRKSEFFVSYDTYTAYSLFAVLCGCKSIVVPDPLLSAEEWYPNVEDRWGIAYGFENIQFATETAPLQIERIHQQVAIVNENVRVAFADILEHFNNQQFRTGPK